MANQNPKKSRRARRRAKLFDKPDPDYESELVIETEPANEENPETETKVECGK